MTDAPGFAGVERRWGDEVIRVVVGEDESLLRRQLLLTLEDHPRLVVTAEVVDVDTLLRAVGEDVPHVVVLDARLPPGGAGAAIAELARAHPEVAVVVVFDASTTEADLPGRHHVNRHDAGTDLADAVVAAAEGRGADPV